MKRIFFLIFLVAVVMNSFAEIIANKSKDGFRYVETNMSDGVFELESYVASSSLNKVALRAIQNEVTKEIRWYILMDIRTYLDIPDNSILLLKREDGMIVEMQSVGDATHSETLTEYGSIKWTSVAYTMNTESMFQLSAPIAKLRIETRWLYVDGKVHKNNLAVDKNWNRVFINQYKEIIETLKKPADIYDGF